MYDFDIDCVEKRQSELLEKYPYAAADIIKAVSLSDKLAKLSKQQVEDLLHPDELLKKFAVKV